MYNRQGWTLPKIFGAENAEIRLPNNKKYSAFARQEKNIFAEFSAAENNNFICSAAEKNNNIINIFGRHTKYNTI